MNRRSPKAPPATPFSLVALPSLLIAIRLAKRLSPRPMAAARQIRTAGEATHFHPSLRSQKTMGRAVALVYGLAAYAAFFVVFLYMIGFAGNMAVPKSIDSGVPVPLGEALLINLGLVGLFAVQHTVMARPAFKAWWTRIVPKPAERSTFVLVSSLILALLFWQWRPMPAVIWEVQHPLAVAGLTGLFFLGWLTILYSSFIIDHFDLFGLRQVFLHFRSRPYTHPPFAVRSLYRIVRHPLMVGFLIAFWSTPVMTAGHLLLALSLTGYILVGVRLEERDLARHVGAEYDRYRSRTPMFLPALPKRKSPETPELGGRAVP